MRLLKDYDSQPQVILNVMLQTLQSMKECLWNDVYEDILKVTENMSEDFHQLKPVIISWLPYLAPPQFELVTIVLSINFIF